jgi:tRNA(Ile)-lysidine synthase
MGPHPAVAETRRCVRRGLDEMDPGDLVLAACSGGADSLALAAALAHEAPRRGLRAGGVTVDHGLQAGSAGRAAAVVVVLTGLGLDPVRSVRVTVSGWPANGSRPGRGTGEPGPGEPGGSDKGAGEDGAGEDGEPGPGGGPEAAARAARYAALGEVAHRTGAAAVLLGHTLDDQAETVLLGLARGSGARSLAGMPARRGYYRRPLLGVSRATLRRACQELGLEPWDDPHNADPAFRRARVRHQVLPALERALGPGIAEALARSARQLRADCDALDALAHAEALRLADSRGGLDIAGLAPLPPAIRTRVLREAALGAGCPAGALTARHVDALDALVTGWRGQRWTDLPGGVRGRRQYGKLLLEAAAAATAGPPGHQDAEGAGGRE